MNMSGGQQQRVAVARSLAMNPDLVLADEPTGNLDTKSADGVFELMRQVNQRNGTTFLIVTHNMDARAPLRPDHRGSRRPHSGAWKGVLGLPGAATATGPSALRQSCEKNVLSFPKIPSGLDSHCKAESSHH